MGMHVRCLPSQLEVWTIWTTYLTKIQNILKHRRLPGLYGTMKLYEAHKTALKMKCVSTLISTAFLVIMRQKTEAPPNRDHSGFKCTDATHKILPCTSQSHMKHDARGPHENSNLGFNLKGTVLSCMYLKNEYLKSYHFHLCRYPGFSDGKLIRVGVQLPEMNTSKDPQQRRPVHYQ